MNEGTNNKQVNIDDFLRPQSMVTPGVAGGITMLITNALWVTFGLSQGFVALAVSFMFGLLVFAAGSAPIWQRLIYYVLNSLIIFSMSVGANAFGGQVSRSNVALHGRTVIQESLSSLGNLGVSAAYAQPVRHRRSPDVMARSHQEQVRNNEAEREKLHREIEQLRSERERLKREVKPSTQARDKKRLFFDHWFQRK